MSDEDALINRRKLGELVEKQLLAQLQTGALKPGDTLPSERELMERYKVGRPSIREAMQSLHRKGLIRIRHGERPRVAEPSFDRTLSELAETMRHVLLFSGGSLGHLKEARILFETQMARRAAEDHAQDNLEHIEATLDQQAMSTVGSPEFMRLDGEFHAAIAKVSANPILESLSRALFSWLSEFHIDQVRKPGLESLTISEHRAIFDAIKAGDAAGAEQQMKNHLTRANDSYKASHLSQSG